MSIFLPSGKNHLSGFLKVPDVSPKNNLWDIRFFESFLFCSCFQTRRDKISDFGNFVRKDFQNCFLRVQRKKKNNIGFSRNSSIFELEQLNFLLENFLKFVKTTLYVSSRQNWGKSFFFVWKLNISFLITWAKFSVTWQKSFSKVVKTDFHVSTGNLWKKKFPDKSYKLCLFCKLSNKFWHHGAFLSHSSHKKVISMCSEDEFKNKLGI